MRGYLLTDVGISDYEAVYDLQLTLVEQKKRNTESHDHLILVEHPDVYTYGRKNQPNDPPETSHSYLVERGGEATFHNIGQLVAYPILRLEDDEQDLHLHLRRLEETLIDVLRDFGVSGEQRDGATGVWIKARDKKIASIGVAVSSWVTYHGSALNVDNDLAGFSRIRPCGFSSGVMTSLREELGGECPSMETVKESYLAHFSKHFNRMLVL